MIEGEVGGGKVAHLADQECQRIADGHENRRAGRGGQSQRTCLLDRTQGDAQIGRMTQRAADPLGDGDQRSPSRLSAGISRSTSSVSPLWESAITISSERMRPRSP